MPNPSSDIQLKITIDNTGAVSSVVNLGKNVDNTEGKVNKLSDTMHMAFIKGGLAFDGLRTMYQTLTGMFGGLLDEYRTQEHANAKVESVIRATGGAAGFTADEVKKLSDELAQNSQYTDDAILDAQGLLLTFKAIGKDVFPQASQAVLDLSATFQQDLKSSAIQLGKALQDPVEGVNALRRVGVSFSDEQIVMIKTLVETNKLAEAQAVILREVESQVKGTDKAMADADGIVKFEKSIGELKETAGSVVSDVVAPVIGGVATISNFMNTNYPTVTKFATGVGLLTASFIILHTTGTTAAITGMIAFVRTIAIAVVANEGFIISIGKTTLALTMMQLAVGGIVAAVAILAGTLYMVYRQSEQLEQQHREQFVASTKKMVDDSIAQLQRLDKVNQKKQIEWEITDAQEQIKTLEANLYRLQHTPGYTKEQIQQVQELLEIEKKRLSSFQNLLSVQEKESKTAQESIEVQLQLEKAKADAMKEGMEKREAIINYEFNKTKSDLLKQKNEREISESQYTQLLKLAGNERNIKLAELREQNAAKERTASIQSFQFRTTIEKEASLAAIDSAEKLALAHTTNEQERLKITKQFALQRIQTELETTLKLLDFEQEKANAIKDSAKRSEALNDIAQRRSKTLSLAGSKTTAADVDYNAGSNQVGQKNADSIKEINKQITDEENDRLFKSRLHSKFYFELDNDLATSKKKLADAQEKLRKTTDAKEAEQLRKERDRQRERIDLINEEKNIREQAAIAAMATAAQQYDSQKSFGAQMNQLINEQIRQQILMHIANAIAGVMAKVIAALGPLGFLVAPAAGLAAQALIQKFIPKFAEGKVGITADGVVTGPGGPKDDNILALISPMETILSAQRTNEYPRTLKMIHAGVFPKIFESSSISKFAEGYFPSLSNRRVDSAITAIAQSAGSSSDDLKKSFKSLENTIKKNRPVVQNYADTDWTRFRKGERKLERIKAAYAL